MLNENIFGVLEFFTQRDNEIMMKKHSNAGSRVKALFYVVKDDVTKST